ncbi:MAG: serine hydrolase [Proteobacteria bacterium]|nr:serine hydrolase [Pseudomonadota bacterium]MBU4296752.1 serine hydrolase [Pseudomonadota bacterium]MCG2745934.1 serine hydrolase [Desulfobulbaceae bacterium]
MRPLLRFLKNTNCPRVLFFGILFLFVWASCPVLANNSKSFNVIKTSYKSAPAKDKAGHRTQLAGDPNGDDTTCVVKKKTDEGARDVAFSGTLRKKLSSRSALVMDSRSGRILYAHEPDRPGQPASTIKIITGLIAINSLRDNDMVKPSRRAAGMPRSKIYISPKKSYAADDLINAVLLASANDASVALAERVAGSETSFAKLMTSKARSLGATHTLCKTATGLTARGQQSTVRDLATVFNKAMQDSEFAQRIGRTKIRTSYGQVLRNHNKALWRVDGAVGGKTGYTQAARQTYVGKFSRGNTELIVALMGSETMWTDVSRLVEYGFKRERQLAAMNGAPSDDSDGPLALSTVPVSFHNNSLQVLTGTKKQPL